MSVTATHARTNQPTAKAFVKPPRKLRILVVEDDPETLDLSIDILEMLGHWVAGVGSAEVALGRFMEGAFDLLLIDMHLPALSGLDLVDKLRQRQNLPVIFASGSSAPPQALANSIWLQKPYTICQLRDALTQVESQLAPEA